jgi:hypothetical protein
MHLQWPPDDRRNALRMLTLEGRAERRAGLLLAVQQAERGGGRLAGRVRVPRLVLFLGIGIFVGPDALG